MLRNELREMVKEFGKAMTRQMLLEQISKLQEKMRTATTIYHAIDIEHDILDRQSMLKWLDAKDV